MKVTTVQGDEYSRCEGIGLDTGAVEDPQENTLGAVTSKWRNGGWRVLLRPRCWGSGGPESGYQSGQCSSKSPGRGRRKVESHGIAGKAEGDGGGYGGRVGRRDRTGAKPVPQVTSVLPRYAGYGPATSLADGCGMVGVKLGAGTLRRRPRRKVMKHQFLL